MSNLKNILQSFKLKDELNPKIWEKSNNKEYSMRPKVRAHLLEIANDFIESLKVDVIVSDIIMTGSLANYNWSNYSDVDLHIIVDFDQFKQKSLPLYDELFHLKKTVYGLKHKITIFGYDVELYVENESIARNVKNAGRFSILTDEWVIKPVKESVNIDVSGVKEKSEKWMKIIDGVEDSIQDSDIETAKKLIKKYVDKIRKFRECGLEKGGEYSDENLVFKILRRNGYLEKIKDMKDRLIDNKLSLKESTTTIGGVFKTDLENSPSNHSKRALGNWQSDNAWDIFASPGTVVNSYTEGTVSKIRDTGKNSGKIFGTQVSIKGNDKFPDIFYTHLKNVKLTNGDIVKVGDYIGEISEWVGHEDSTHVHIGLPRGNHLKDLLINSDKIFTGSKDSTETPHSDSTFLSSLEDISSSGKEYKNLKSPGKSIPYDSDVEKIQTALQILGYSLPKWGVDGLFGPETESAVLKFESDNGITPDGKLTDEDIEKMVELLESKGFDDSDLSKIQKTSDFDKINIGGDKDFYEAVLNGIGAPITDENMKFFYAWRKGEGGKATNNPFNTTFTLKKDSGMSNYNSVGVKNYSTPNYGVEATVKTLLLSYYTCIVDGLKNDVGSDKISRCESLKTWGTGDLVAKVLNSGNITPPKIYTA